MKKKGLRNITQDCNEAHTSENAFKPSCGSAKGQMRFSLSPVFYDSTLMFVPLYVCLLSWLHACATVACSTLPCWAAKMRPRLELCTASGEFCAMSFAHSIARERTCALGTTRLTLARTALGEQPSAEDTARELTSQSGCGPPEPTRFGPGAASPMRTVGKRA